jgi:hypothetical protein
MEYKLINKFSLILKKANIFHIREFASHFDVTKLEEANKLYFEKSEAPIMPLGIIPVNETKKNDTYLATSGFINCLSTNNKFRIFNLITEDEHNNNDVPKFKSIKKSLNIYKKIENFLNILYKDFKNFNQENANICKNQFNYKCERCKSLCPFLEDKRKNYFSSIEWKERVSEIIKYINSKPDENFFIIGGSKVGKSYLLKLIKEKIKNKVIYSNDNYKEYKELKATLNIDNKLAVQHKKYKIFKEKLLKIASSNKTNFICERSISDFIIFTNLILKNSVNQKKEIKLKNLMLDDFYNIEGKFKGNYILLKSNFVTSNFPDEQMIPLYKKLM